MTVIDTHPMRLAKLLCLAGIALHLSLAAFGNLTDYGTNWAFVQHVLAMDTTFNRPALMWRAITDPNVQTAAYLAIIGAETLGAILLWWGFAKLWRARQALPQDFHDAKGLAVLALAWAFSIWMIGFVAIGAEWFAMWQSATWNGQATATGFALLTGVVMVFVAQRE